MIDRVLQLGYFTLRFPVDGPPPRAGRPRRARRLHGPDRPRGPPGPAPRLPVRRGAEAGPVRRRARALARDPGRATSPASRPGEAVRVGERVVHPDDVMGPPRAGPFRRLLRGQRPLRGDPQALAGRDAPDPRGDDRARTWRSRRTSGATPRPARPRELAQAAEVGGLFLTHFSSRYKETQALEDEAKARVRRREGRARPPRPPHPPAMIRADLLVDGIGDLATLRRGRRPRAPATGRAISDASRTRRSPSPTVGRFVFVGRVDRRPDREVRRASRGVARSTWAGPRSSPGSSTPTPTSCSPGTVPTSSLRRSRDSLRARSPDGAAASTRRSAPPGEPPTADAPRDRPDPSRPDGRATARRRPR